MKVSSFASPEHKAFIAEHEERHQKFMTRHGHVTRRSLPESSDVAVRHHPRFGFSQKLPPSRCPDCQGTLKITTYERYSEGHLTGGSAFRKWCGCGCYIEWSFPNVWVRRHELPMLDMPDMRIVVQEA